MMPSKLLSRCSVTGGDRGAMVVESALVLPIVFWLVLALIDFSLVELHQSQLTSAAKDGARAGIVAWEDADDPVSASHLAIVDEVHQRMPGTQADGIDVACLEGQSDTEVACSTGAVRPGVDTLRVTLTATFSPVTFVGEMFMGRTLTYSVTARMVVQ